MITQFPWKLETCIYGKLYKYQIVPLSTDVPILSNLA